MAESVFMAIEDSTHDLSEYICCFDFSEGFVLEDLLDKLSASAQLLHQIYVLVVLIYLVEFDYIRMIKTL